MMSGLPPVQVSPLIRLARYSFLFVGIIFGNIKFHQLKIYDAKLVAIRKQEHENKLKMLKERALQNDSNNMKDLFQNLGETDFPPGWDDFVK